jgi:phosphatidylglycerol---prolipoprotein diacylglyceryl transferase
MQQVLVRIPDPFGWFPDGIPIYSYGAMLFVTFLACTWFAMHFAYRAGVPKERLMDLGIWLFVCGIIGGRVVYMVQYNVPWRKFLNLWEGGLVIYGALIGGFIGYWVFYLLFLKKIHVSSWRLGDVAAPAICIGLALGRVGCLLNGCCYGGVAGDSCPALEFPLLTSPAREALVEGEIGAGRYQYQTLVGFAAKDREPGDLDVRTIVGAIEPGSPAERSGLQTGDRIIAVNEMPNSAVLLVGGPRGRIEEVKKAAAEQGHRVTDLGGTDDRITIKVHLDDPTKAVAFRAEVNRQGLPVGHPEDTLNDLLRDWPRGKTELRLQVDRDGREVTIDPFTPQTLGLHPTQLYETISMFLLLFLLLAYYPFRRHNGQVFVLFMMGYAVHRFLNEILRDDTPIEGFGMTLSQNISIGIFGAAIVLELFLRLTQPKRTVSGVDEYAAEKEAQTTEGKPA